MRKPIRDTASMHWRRILFGGGVFDVSGEHPNRKGWEIYELGQTSFWAVPTAIPWHQPVREDPQYAEAIAAMLAFLCPGEKAAVTGASYISNLVPSEEAKFYFAEQALEEAKHYDAMSRLIPKITGCPMTPPGPWVRLLYSFGVVERDDVAFMMGNINIIGEHLAHQILHQINRVATDPIVRQVIAFIGRDESRHIAAGQRFFPEVYPEFRKHRLRIMAKNLATTIILSLAGADLVNPMRALRIDLADVMEQMYRHYYEVTAELPAFPEQALLELLFQLVRRGTPRAIRTISAMTDEQGAFSSGRFLAACQRAVRSPRALRDLFAA
ncbi:MAG TPA: ferritin-like domain-containing protein [Polyangia bacterium]|nr:ferritin-like domain-containing protein [Polyangia bacterium]